MYLPPSEHLAVDTLSGIFSDMSESYKIFWFNSILQGIASGHIRETFDEIINRMVVDAWYMVTEYHLNLGPSDVLNVCYRNTETSYRNCQNKYVISCKLNVHMLYLAPLHGIKYCIGGNYEESMV